MYLDILRMWRSVVEMVGFYHVGKIYVTRECIARGELQIYYCFCWKSESRIGTILIFRFKIQSYLSLPRIFPSLAKEIAINRNSLGENLRAILFPFSLSLFLAIFVTRKSARKNNRWGIRCKKVARLIRHGMNYALTPRFFELLLRISPQIIDYISFQERKLHCE